MVLVDEHGEKGNDVLSLIVRNLSIDECLFNKGTIVQRMDIQMSSFSTKPGLDQKTNRTNGTVEDPDDGNITEHAYPGVSLVFSYLQVCKASIIPPLFARSVMLQS